MEDQIVIIKRYNFATEAYIDAGMLRENGIECAINGDNASAALPYLQEAITLSVRSDDQKVALQLLHHQN